MIFNPELFACSAKARGFSKKNYWLGLNKVYEFTTMMTDKSQNTIRLLDQYEAASTRYQPNIVWSDLANSLIKDQDGKCYIDFSSSVLVANAGHGSPEIKAAIVETVEKGLLSSYGFPTAERAALVKKLHDITCKSYKTALFNSGSEAIEAVIKIVLNWFSSQNSHSKNKFISYKNSYHGKTLGASLLSGYRKGNWINYLIRENTSFVHVEFPNKTSELDHFENQISSIGIDNNEVACIIIEPYQGIIGRLAPAVYMKQLSKWCKSNNVVLAVDEIQSGFGRTGRLWGYEHFEIKPDIIVCGKGLSSSLPISAVIGEEKLMDASPPGSLASTHSGNPVCCSAACASIEKISSTEFLDRVVEVSQIFQERIRQIGDRYSAKLIEVDGVGMMAAMHFSAVERPIAQDVVEYAISNGLMLCRSGGISSATVKISPPLTISNSDLTRGLEILEEAIRHA